MIELDLNSLNFEKGGGLVAVVAQDADTGVVLMMAHADRVALALAISTGEMHYTSRSRGLWHKGSTSGNRQHVVTLTADCDRDAVLARVRPTGPSCHAGTVSCFRDDALNADALSVLDRTIAARATSLTAALGEDTNGYTHRLLTDRNLRLKKLGEEALELAVACADGDQARAIEEGADVIYHTLVALRALNVSLDDVRRTLASRAGASVVARA